MIQVHVHSQHKPDLSYQVHVVSQHKIGYKLYVHVISQHKPDISYRYTAIVYINQTYAIGTRR